MKNRIIINGYLSFYLCIMTFELIIEINIFKVFIALLNIFKLFVLLFTLFFFTFYETIMLVTFIFLIRSHSSNKYLEYKM